MNKNKLWGWVKEITTDEAKQLYEKPSIRSLSGTYGIIKEPCKKHIEFEELCIGKIGSNEFNSFKKNYNFTFCPNCGFYIGKKRTA